MDEIQTPADRSAAKRWGTAAALVAAGIAGGVIMAGTVSANAASSTPSPSTSSSASAGTNGTDGTAGTPKLAPPTNPNPGDPSKPQRSDETLLTGDVAAKVKAAALAKYPDATVIRVETDSDGVYEAHLTKADGTEVIVQVDKSYTVTGEQTGGGRGHGGPGGMPGGVDPDPNDNDGPGTSNPGTGTLTPNSSSSTSSSSLNG